MIALAALALLAGPPDGGAFTVPPRTIAWDELSPEHFDLARRLPARRRAPGRDLLAEMRRLLELSFEIELDGRPLRGLGDLARAAWEVPRDERREWLARLAQEAPGLWADWGGGLSELLLDDHLYSERWNPDRDHPRDGILLAEPWDLGGEGPPWSRLGGNHRIEQSAVLYRADPAAVKAVEQDYSTYRNNVGAQYEAIHPVAGSHVRGTDPRGNAFAALRLYFRCDLPFPFGGYECDLHVLDTVDAEGLLTTDIYAPNDDFQWLLGRDVYFPVRAGDGDWVGTLVVRFFGFDVDDVPDGPEHRQSAMRASLGNLKRKSETLFAAGDREPRAVEGEVPDYEVRGRR